MPEDLTERITTDPEQRGGRSCIRGLRGAEGREIFEATRRRERR